MSWWSGTGPEVFQQQLTILYAVSETWLQSASNPETHRVEFDGQCPFLTTAVIEPHNRDVWSLAKHHLAKLARMDRRLGL